MLLTSALMTGILTRLGAKKVQGKAILLLLGVFSRSAKYRELAYLLQDLFLFDTAVKTHLYKEAI
jgi:hypothetical protein